MKKNILPNHPISAVILGAGSRGNSYAAYALQYPNELKIIGVAESDSIRRKRFSQKHAISSEKCFSDWRDLLDKGKFADVAFICTQDNMHFEPAVAAMNKGYHLLLEKPISNNKEECLTILREYRKHNVSVAVAHVLRYTDFFSRIKELIDNDEIGKIKGIQHNENIGHIHYSHSYVRGNWRKESISSPIILAKSCHDMDILLYLTGATSVKISSFANRTTFIAENKPEKTPYRCLDGCSNSKYCPYYAPKIYMTGSYGWPVDTITTDLSQEGIKKALEDGPYGRCVYSCDNDVMEHQTVNLEFDNSIPVVFSMSAFTEKTTRTIKIVGEKGQINGHMEKNEIEIHNFQTNDIKKIFLKSRSASHGGGDTEIIKDLLIHLKDRNIPLKSSIENSVQSHLMAFAVEDSRKNNKIVTVDTSSLQ